MCTNVPLTGTGCSPADICFSNGFCDAGSCVPDESPIGCVDVELRTPLAPIKVGDVVDVELRFINNCGGFGTEVSAMDVIVSWDPAILAPADRNLIGEPNPEDPCVGCRVCVGGDNNGSFCFTDTDCPPAGLASCEGGVPANNCDPGQPCCDEGTTCDFDCGRIDVYNWGISAFRKDSGDLEDSINADCSPTVFCDPYTGVPFNDGTLLYVATQQLLCSGFAAPPATVPSGSTGLLVTKLKFVALEATRGITDGTQLTVERCIGQTRTKVLSPGLENTGTLSPSGLLVVECVINADCPTGLACVNGACDACQAPAVATAGPRYIDVTPAETVPEVAFFVTGVSSDVLCVAGYVQANGKLGIQPVYLPPSGPGGWNTVHVRGNELLSDRTYNVQADCDSANPGTSLSEPVSATLWTFADADNTGPPVEIVDAVHALDGFSGTFHTISCVNDSDCSSVLPFKRCDLDVGKCLWNTKEIIDWVGSLNRCMPDQSIDIVTDVVAAIDSFSGVFIPCPSPCP